MTTWAWPASMVACSVKTGHINKLAIIEGMKLEPKFINYRQKIEDSFNRQGFMKLIGAKLVDVQVGYCEIEVPYRKDLTQQHGFFHAGVISTIADNTAGYAAFSVIEESSSILTVEFKLNLMSPGDGEKLIGKSKVLKHGRTLTICRSEVYVEKEGVKKLCAAAQSTLIELKNTSDKAENNSK